MKKFLLSLSVAALALSAAAQTETVYFQEDFEWIAPWAQAGKTGDGSIPAGDTVGSNGKQTEAPKADACKVNDVSGLEALKEKGYDLISVYDFKDNKNKTDISLYLQQNYLKFNKTGKTTSNGKGFQLGLVLPPAATQDVPTGTELCVGFDWCPMMQGAGTNYVYDKTQLAVWVVNGTDTVYVNSTKQEWPNGTADGANYEWKHSVAELKNVTINKDTKLIICTDKESWDQTNARRWFIDNIKVYSTGTSAINEVGVDENAPAEYYNVQGMRVANPGSGLYIVKQGNKVAKKLIVK